ncbi:MAG TPA: hypothetical protein VOA88_01125 [Candidatus Dormibacteraeota bacterium]|nr:hypothetical protein [Candidatus Dormibacteraeota bacterium]
MDLHKDIEAKAFALVMANKVKAAAGKELSVDDIVETFFKERYFEIVGEPLKRTVQPTQKLKDLMLIVQNGL